MKHLTKQMNSVRNVRGIRMQSNIIVYIENASHAEGWVFESQPQQI